MKFIEANDSRARTNERREACAAVDAMIAARPRKPPPLPASTRTRTAGELALAKEIKAGTYAHGRQKLWSA